VVHFVEIRVRLRDVHEIFGQVRQFTVCATRLMAVLVGRNAQTGLRIQSEVALQLWTRKKTKQGQSTEAV
jgi:hypothetical protein